MLQRPIGSGGAPQATHRTVACRMIVCRWSYREKAHTTERPNGVGSARCLQFLIDNLRWKTGWLDWSGAREDRSCRRSGRASVPPGSGGGSAPRIRYARDHVTPRAGELAGFGPLIVSASQGFRRCATIPDDDPRSDTDRPGPARRAVREPWPQPAQIAAQLAVGVRTVRDRLCDHRIPARPMGHPKGTGRPVLRPEKILTRRYLLDAYHRRGLSVPHIGAEAGFATKTVLKYLRLHGIPTRPSGANSIQRRKVDAERLAALRQQGLSVAEIAARVSCAERTIVASFHRYNMDLPRAGSGPTTSTPTSLPPCAGRD